jgi:hypothetical protein
LRGTQYNARPADVSDTGKSLAAYYVIQDAETHGEREREQAWNHGTIISADVAGN